MSQFVESFQRFRVVDIRVIDASGIVKLRMLRADSRIVQASRHRMRRHNLSIVVLQDVRERSVKHARSSAGKSRRMIAESGTSTTGLNADHLYLFIRDEVEEESNGIAS